jgi:hypothetical protein
MKTAKLLITVLITIGILLTGYFSFRYSSTGINSIGNSVTLAYIFFVLLVLLSYRVSFSGNTKPALSKTLLAILLIAGFSIMYFQRSSVVHIWNYVLAGFVVYQGLNLMELHKGKNRLASILQLTTIITILFLSSLFILKVNKPVLYLIGLALLIPPTLLSMVDSFRKSD